MEALWLRGWLQHCAWLQARATDRASRRLLKDGPATHLSCRFCAASGQLYRRVDGPAGPAAHWVCYQCLPDLAVRHMISTVFLPLEPSGSRAYLQDRLRCYRSLGFLEAQGNFEGHRTRRSFSYSLISLTDEATSPAMTLSMYELIPSPRACRRDRRGYLNCGVDGYTGQTALLVSGQASRWLFPSLLEALEARRAVLQQDPAKDDGRAFAQPGVLSEGLQTQD
jgi:hypothetical protein